MAVVGEGAAWTLTDYLLALLVDVERLALWQRGGKGPRPKPLPRPGVEDETVRRFGKGGRPAASGAEWQARKRWTTEEVS